MGTYQFLKEGGSMTLTGQPLLEVTILHLWLSLGNSSRAMQFLIQRPSLPHGLASPREPQHCPPLLAGIPERVTAVPFVLPPPLWTCNRLKRLRSISPTSSTLGMSLTVLPARHDRPPIFPLAMGSEPPPSLPREQLTSSLPADLGGLLEQH
ncbi:hypothetical protein VNO77_03166 [Canavalia gladiata]|uniref:Uncharacterized protein n=1 Tax=Canavalia gladiata TaxID=3824 RepID=A0AAN9MUD0_CANGL